MSGYTDMQENIQSLPAAAASPQPCETEDIIRDWIVSESGPGGPWADTNPSANLKWVTLDGEFDLLALANALIAAERERCAKIAAKYAECAESVGGPDFSAAILEEIRSGE